MKNIKMVDLWAQHEPIQEELDEAIGSVIRNSAFINGPEVHAFKSNLKNYLSCEHVIPCANGTDALMIALTALELQPGDEVIVPSFSYVAAVEMVALLGLTPVFVDVDPNYFWLDLENLKQRLNAKTKAVIAVHLFGQSGDMHELMNLSHEHDFWVIEDNAQSIGANYKNDLSKGKLGTLGHVSTTSFFPSKNLGCMGDGGAIYTNHQQIADKCLQFASHGQATKYFYDKVGCNSRLDTIQAAILDVKLKHLDSYIIGRQNVANKYDQAFSDHDMIKIPQRSPYSDHVFHQYTIQLKSSTVRKHLKNNLSQSGIPSMIYYPEPLHVARAYQSFYDNKDLNGSINLSDTVLSLPIYPEMPKDTQDYIIDQVKRHLS